MHALVCPYWKSVHIIRMGWLNETYRLWYIMHVLWCYMLVYVGLKCQMPVFGQWHCHMQFMCGISLHLWTPEFPHWNSFWKPSLIFLLFKILRFGVAQLASLILIYRMARNSQNGNHEHNEDVLLVTHCKIASAIGEILNLVTHAISSRYHIYCW